MLSSRPTAVGIPARLTMALLIVLLVSTRAATAHPLTFTDATIVLRPGGTFQADLIVDLDALALGAPQDADDAGLVAALRALSPDELDDRVDRLRQLFQRRVRFRFDGEPAPFEVSFPDRGTPAATESEIPTLLGLTARLNGRVPAEATELEFFASRAFSEVNLTIRDETRNLTSRALLEPGARSDPFPLAGAVEPPTTLSIGLQYLQLGFVHIVPRGLDHILFVLGLFLLGTRLRPLVWQVTAFTVAHAATLSLAVFDVVSLPATLVEPLIALSIVYVAVENVLTDRLHPWRPAVVFGFGLLHGLGFAGVLQEIGLPQQERLLGLLSFNVGIELGQLLVIALALAAVGWCRHRVWYRSRVGIPVSSAIAAVGLFWTLERALGG
ncbi:MAG: HupE/UreJ family protein [Vicinamibacterales bacterium]|nr:HupE/UreJ family protein [Vicinamibacterales bacterium]MDP7691169.1 HupE/UreJ family protein [Vicinamibacterales bacterium]HJN45847.1 HupE/UreJ family protein [Vicinamibacterales bacterium]